MVPVVTDTVTDCLTTHLISKSLSCCLCRNCQITKMLKLFDQKAEKKSWFCPSWVGVSEFVNLRSAAWNTGDSFSWKHMSYPSVLTLSLAAHILSLSSTPSSIRLLPCMSSAPRLFVLSQGHGQSRARACAPSSYWPFVPPLSQTSLPWAT